MGVDAPHSPLALAVKDPKARETRVQSDSDIGSSIPDLESLPPDFDGAAADEPTPIKVSFPSFHDPWPPVPAHGMLTAGSAWTPTGEPGPGECERGD